MPETVGDAASKGSPAAPDREVFASPGGRIVVGLDGSPESVQALRAAARLAEVTGAALDVLSVCTVPATIEFPETGFDGWNPPAETRANLEAILQQVFGADRPQNLRTAVPQGNPAEEILRAAQGASMIAIGSRGHGALTGMLLGSVSIKCAAAAPCPVLIVHAPTNPGG